MLLWALKNISKLVSYLGIVRFRTSSSPKVTINAEAFWRKLFITFEDCCSINTIFFKFSLSTLSIRFLFSLPSPIRINLYLIYFLTNMLHQLMYLVIELCPRLPAKININFLLKIFILLLNF